MNRKVSAVTTALTAAIILGFTACGKHVQNPGMEQGQAVIAVEQAEAEEEQAVIAGQAQDAETELLSDGDFAHADNGESFTDSRDNQRYRIVKIGDLTWMAQNLNFQTGNSWCYDDDESNCQKYGRLYDWNAAMTACPAGWRLPTDDDWNNLVQAAGGGDVAGTRLKSKSPAWNGTDDFGFSALPGGGRLTGGNFNAVGVYGDWWSTTEKDASNAWGRHMGSGSENVIRDYWDKSRGLSVVCAQD
jgi:uncharacterized protein (TIGR02145 family)